MGPKRWKKKMVSKWLSIQVSRGFEQVFLNKATFSRTKVFVVELVACAKIAGRDSDVNPLGKNL